MFPRHFPGPAKTTQGSAVKLTAKSIAGLTLPADKRDVIFFDSEIRGLGYRLRRSPSGEVRASWILQFRAAGRSRRYLIGSAEVGAQEARAKAQKLKGRIWQGEDPQAGRLDQRDKDRVTFHGTAKEFLTAKEREGLRPRTLFQLRRYLLDGPYLKAFHALPLDRVSKRDVAARILRITGENGPAIAREVRSALSSFFIWSRRMGLCESNPVIDTQRPKCNGPRERVLSDDELRRIWLACKDDDYGRIVRLLILAGCRRAEIGDMRWSEIDLDSGIWTLPAERSKNGKQHVLPLMPAMREIVDGVPRMATRDALFGQRSKGFTAWSWKESKPALDERSGVRDWTVHDIRRTVATRMADIGVQPHVIEAALNHHSGHRTGIAGVYNRSTYEREVKAALATWHDHLRSIIEGGERKVVNFQPAPAAAVS
jgi:integrase